MNFWNFTKKIGLWTQMHTNFAKCLLINVQDLILIMWPPQKKIVNEAMNSIQKQNNLFVELECHTNSMALEDVVNITTHVHQLTNQCPQP
jgi:hypothetical protein